MTTISDDTLITLVDDDTTTDPNELMRKGLESASKLETTYTDKPASIGFVMGECLDVKDEINRLSLTVSQLSTVTMCKSDVDKAIKAYNAEWLDPQLKQINKTLDMTRERDIALLNNRYDHLIKILDRITLGGAIMFGVAMFTVLFLEYLQP